MRHHYFAMPPEWVPDMGKIQKALDRLREGDERGSHAAKAATPASSESQSRSRPLDENSRNVLGPSFKHRRYSLPDEKSVEIPAKYSINVDIEALSEFGLQARGEEFDQLAQEFRRIKRPILNIIFGEIGAGTVNSNVVMIASALPETGKTFCSYNLALSIARERDIGAVIVDADVLKRNISKAFGNENRVGLIDYLLNPDTTLDDILVGTNLHDIVVVPAGQQHDEATELLASRRMEQFTHELSLRFEARAIIVDTPPLLLTNEAQVLAEHMGQIVVVVDTGTTTHDSLAESLKSLNRDKPINAIMNRARGSLGNSYGDRYGGGYFGYYSVPRNQRDAE